MNIKVTPSSVDHLMEENRVFPPPLTIQQQAHIQNLKQYEQMYFRSIEDAESFWLEMAKNLDWIKPPTIACKYTWDTLQNEIQHTWFEDGQINVSQNCLDRHVLNGKGQKLAIIWEGDEGKKITFTYQELLTEVCRFANVLKDQGIKKGERVCIYMPVVPETVIAMLACARIGAIHSVVFGGFSAESLTNRLNDASCRLLITSNVSKRGGKSIPLKTIADEALQNAVSIEKVIVFKRTEEPCPMTNGRDFWYDELIALSSSNCPVTSMKAEDILFILYTSGSTGKPKGVVHTQAGYLLHTSLTHKYVFDIHDKDIYWCTADVGWITGHSYVVYGPLSNGTTIMLFEGVPTYPDCGRYWKIIDNYQVSVFYTAPTAIRTLIRHGENWPKEYKLDSLRVLGTVGEPINPEAWMWYYQIIGKQNCPIVDTWWQTETGGIMISALPGVHSTKPGSANKPFFGIKPAILKDDGSACKTNEGGNLCIDRPWPGIMRTLWGDHDRFINTYFKAIPNHYFTGDSCRIDKEGDYWLMGRVDDVANVAGHRIGTAEVESALVSHLSVAEAAVVPMSHEIKGQVLCAYVILKDGIKEDPSLKTSLSAHVKKVIGPIATPDKILFTKVLPKTRSGKIMRRLLRKIVEGNTEELGDTSTLAEAHIIHELIKITQN